ncbi:BolA/IbaG family iron-sulfur metabolism protein [Gammaproteobacteria bacterium]|jgi:acid stress-induced BolA-like protein IbaG/YrbA|nr:BolA/IbaG family iron-sulfur metabolism protein [Gammaproteobacteria bacterium]|tara:strand:+ start:1641 stop:1880 length:240 start_codon:yes stop_codon:yes gene_type:complete
MNPQIIKELIEAGLPDANIIVEGDDGTHFQARIICEAFTGKSMLQQHQMVYKTLGDKMGTDIHALSIQTHTPVEWDEQK